MFFAANGVLAVVLFGFWIWAILDVIATPGDTCRNLPKVAWLIVVVVLADIGAVAWLLLGRPPRGAARTRPSDYRAARRPIAVEDEPRFLPAPAMTDRRSQELDRQLDEWEAEQRRKRAEGDADES
jgi:hypothetical protein